MMRYNDDLFNELLIDPFRILWCAPKKSIHIIQSSIVLFFICTYVGWGFFEILYIYTSELLIAGLFGFVFLLVYDFVKGSSTPVFNSFLVLLFIFLYCIPLLYLMDYNIDKFMIFSSYDYTVHNSYFVPYLAGHWSLALGLFVITWVEIYFVHITRNNKSYYDDFRAFSYFKRMILFMIFIGMIANLHSGNGGWLILIVFKTYIDLYFLAQTSRGEIKK